MNLILSLAIFALSVVFVKLLLDGTTDIEPETINDERFEAAREE